MSNKQLYSIQQAADRIGCSRSTVSRYARSLRLGVVVGSSVILSGPDVIQIDNARQSAPGRPSQKKDKKSSSSN